jgi:ribosome biogenesis GTPase / thiamine phosphate phosphatase
MNAEPERNESTAPSTHLKGRVILHLGKSLAVETPTGNVIACHTRRRLSTAAVGDWVLWEPCEGNLGRVVQILPRTSLLLRPGRNGKTRPVAANLDQLLIVFSVRPPCDFLLIDQYLVVCERHSINPILIFNKIDLSCGKETIAPQLSVYRSLGYRILNISAKTGQGLTELRGILAGHTSMLAGQSGVGKSSLTNALLPDKELRVAALSRGSGHGKHTTTTATLYHLPDGGDLIDSPGVAIFGLAEISEQALAEGFREFKEHIEHCRFHNCRHVNDKGCAVRAAVDQRIISRDRYQRFLKLREKLPA